MAEGYEPCPRLYVSYDNIVNRWDTTTTFDGTVRKSCGVVNIYYRGYDSTKSHIAIFSPLAEIPEGYRPPINIPVIGFIKLAEDNFYRACNVWVYTNGEIGLNFSGSYHVEDLWISGSYGVP